MVLNRMKYVLILLLLVGVAGAFSWFLYQWLVMDKSIPDGAIKVLGWMLNSI